MHTGGKARIENRGWRIAGTSLAPSSIVHPRVPTELLTRLGLLAVAEVLADGLLGGAGDAVLVDFVGGFLVVRAVGLGEVDLARALLRRRLHQRAGEDLALFVHLAGGDVLHDVVGSFRDLGLAAGADAGAAHALALLVGVAVLPLAVALAPLGVAVLVVLAGVAVVAALAVVA